MPTMTLKIFAEFNEKRIYELLYCNMMQITKEFALKWIFQILIFLPYCSKVAHTLNEKGSECVV